jgi:hypothetical protein
MNDLKFTTAGNYMDSKIDDLMYQSGLTASGCWDEMDSYDKEAIENFGKLIVKECLNNMNNCDGDLDFEIWKTKEDFGVE